MTVYQTIVCDRCGKEQKKEVSDSWAGWHEEASIHCRGITRLYSGTPNFTWHGTLCSGCAGAVDEVIRNLMRPLDTPDAFLADLKRRGGVEK